MDRGKRSSIDVAVTSPLAPTYVRMVAPCGGMPQDLSFADTDYLFSAMVFETLGATNSAGFSY